MTDTKIELAVQATNERIDKLAEMMAAFLAAQKTEVVSPPVSSVQAETVLTLVANPTDPQLREFAKANQFTVSTRGRIGAEDAIRRQYRLAYEAANGRVAAQAAPASMSRWGSSTTSTGTKREPIPSRKDAAEMLASHPEKSTLESMSSDDLWAFARAGKPNAVKTLQNIPLTGNHRRCIGLLARGTDTANVRLVVADAITIAKSAGVSF